jgi:formate dehydrogenase subunit delta
MQATCGDRTLAILVHDANQIARFFEAQPRRDPAQGAAEHLRLFWAPSLRAALGRHLDRGGEGLSPIARRAASLVAERRPADPDSWPPSSATL